VVDPHDGVISQYSEEKERRRREAIENQRVPPPLLLLLPYDRYKLSCFILYIIMASFHVHGIFNSTTTTTTTSTRGLGSSSGMGNNALKRYYRRSI